MSRTLVIEFPKGGKPRLRVDLEVSGAQAVCQGAAVNLASHKGDDRIFAERGTGLAEGLATSRVGNAEALDHITKFAAIDTLFFSRTHGVAESADKLEKVALTPEAYGGEELNLLASFETVDGRVLSYPFDES